MAKWQGNCFVSSRSWVQFPLVAVFLLPAGSYTVGGLAQMVERLLSMQEAQGSIPWSSTTCFLFWAVALV